jgi:glycyl-tRNA synthetase (class II)
MTIVAVRIIQFVLRAQARAGVRRVSLEFINDSSVSSDSQQRRTVLKLYGRLAPRLSTVGRLL